MLLWGRSGSIVNAFESIPGLRGIKKGFGQNAGDKTEGLSDGNATKVSTLETIGFCSCWENSEFAAFTKASKAEGRVGERRLPKSTSPMSSRRACFWARTSRESQNELAVETTEGLVPSAGRCTMETGEAAGARATSKTADMSTVTRKRQNIRSKSSWRLTKPLDEHEHEIFWLA